jgi:hypothetical protein
MEKFVHLFEIFKTIFYLKNLRSGKSFLSWSNFEQIQNWFKFVWNLWIGLNRAGTVPGPMRQHPHSLVLPLFERHPATHRHRAWAAVAPLDSVWARTAYHRAPFSHRPRAGPHPSIFISSPGLHHGHRHTVFTKRATPSATAVPARAGAPSRRGAALGAEPQRLAHRRSSTMQLVPPPGVSPALATFLVRSKTGDLQNGFALSSSSSHRSLLPPSSTVRCHRLSFPRRVRATPSVPLLSSHATQRRARPWRWPLFSEEMCHEEENELPLSFVLIYSSFLKIHNK